MIRVRISYRDAAEAVETFKQYDHAARFADAMAAQFSSVVTEIAVEHHCRLHGWEHTDDVKCDRCGDIADCTNDLEYGDDEFWRLCGECVEQVAEDRAGECSCGYFCSRCTGVPASGPI